MRSTCLFLIVVWKTEGPRVNFVMRETLFRKITRGSSHFHNTVRNKQVECNLYIYTLSKLSRFDYDISVFNTQQGGIRNCRKKPPTYTSRERFHGRMDVNIFLMFIEAENTGSVNIAVYFYNASLLNINVTDYYTWEADSSRTPGF